MQDHNSSIPSSVSHELLNVQVVYDVLKALNTRISESAAERAEFRKFTLKDEGLVPVGSMPDAQSEE